MLGDAGRTSMRLTMPRLDGDTEPD